MKEARYFIASIVAMLAPAPAVAYAFNWLSWSAEPSLLLDLGYSAALVIALTVSAFAMLAVFAIIATVLSGNRL